MAQTNNSSTIADTVFDVENIFLTDADMHYAFQVSLVFSLAGNVIEFLLGRKKNYLKRKKPKGKTEASNSDVVKKPNAPLCCLPDRYRAT
jgi:hypothetical protein